MDDRRGSLAAVDAQALTAEAAAAIRGAESTEALEELRVRYLGRKSELKLALREVRDRETGMALNAARQAVEEALAAREAELAAVPGDDPTFDPTLPGEPVPRGSLHLITQLRRRIEDVFLGMGYVVYDGREVETVWHNFDALNQPRGAPVARPAGHVLLRREHAAAHAHVALADPCDAGAGAADLPRLARTHLPARPARRDAHARVPPGRGPRRRPGDHARRPAWHDRALHERDLRQARGADADELLPLHRAVGRVRHHLLPLRRTGLPRLQALGLDRDGRRRRRRSERPRGGRVRPRGVARASRSGSGSTGSRSCGTACPTCGSSGRTTCA